MASAEGQDPVHHRRQPRHRPAIALRAARDGANIAIAAKTAEPHPKLPGTIHTAAEEIEAAGGQALPLRATSATRTQVAGRRCQDGRDVRRHRHLRQQRQRDSLTPIARRPTIKRFDLMHGVNARGTFLVSKTCLPHLRKPRTRTSSRCRRRST